MDELSIRLKELEDAEDEIDSMARQFQREEDEEDIRISNSLSKLEELEEYYLGVDGKIGQIIDEKRDILGRLKEEKIQFADEFYKMVQEEKNKIDIERKEIQKQNAK